jgi:hypothetical protein
MTFQPGALVYWLRPSDHGDGGVSRIPAEVVQAHGGRVTIRAWGLHGTLRLVSVLARQLTARETLGDVVDRLEQKGKRR